MASDAFERFGISREELEEMVRAEAEVNSALNDFMEKEVVPYAKSVTPVDSGNAAASIKVVKKAKRGKGKVAGTAWYFGFIEYGTKADTKGSDERKVLTKDGWRTLPKDTPTQAAAPMEKTARHFGGTLGEGGSGGIEFGDDEQ